MHLGLFSQVSASYSYDDMLRIEPLELHFSYKLHKEMSWTVHLTNETDSSVAFYIQTEMSSLIYSIEPEKGIVPPSSKISIRIILSLQGKNMQQPRPFVVRSTKVNVCLKIEEITKDIFNNEMDNMVDEVDLDVVLVREVSTCVSNRKLMHLAFGIFWSRGTRLHVKYICAPFSLHS